MGSFRSLKSELVSKIVDDEMDNTPAEEVEEEVGAEEVEEEVAAEDEESEAEDGDVTAEATEDDGEEIVEMEFEDFTWMGEKFRVPKGEKEKAKKFFDTHYTQKMQKLSEEHKHKTGAAEAKLAEAMKLEELARKRQEHVQAVLDANPELARAFKRAEGETSKRGMEGELLERLERIEREKKIHEIQVQTDRELEYLASRYKLEDDQFYSQEDIRDRALAIALANGAELADAYVQAYDHFANRDAEKRSSLKEKKKSVISSKVKAKNKHSPVKRGVAVQKPKQKQEKPKGKFSRVRELLDKL